MYAGEGHSSSGGGGLPWYLQRDVQCEAAAPYEVLRELGLYSGSFVQVRCDYRQGLEWSQALKLKH